MVIAILSVMGAGSGVITYSMGLVSLPNTLEVMEHQKEKLKDLYDSKEIDENYYW